MTQPTTAAPCKCGHDRDRHEIEPPYPCYDCDCNGFQIATAAPKHKWKAQTEWFGYCDNCGAEQDDDNHDEECTAAPDDVEQRAREFFSSIPSIFDVLQVSDGKTESEMDYHVRIASAFARHQTADLTRRLADAEAVVDFYGTCGGLEAQGYRLKYPATSPQGENDE